MRGGRNWSLRHQEQTVTMETQKEKRARLLPDVIRLTKEGCLQKEITEEIGVSGPTISRWLRDAGVLSTIDAKRARLKPEAVRLYHRGWSHKRIGRKLCVRDTTVGKWLREDGLQPVRVQLPKTTPIEDRLAYGSGVKDPITECVEWARGREFDGYGQLHFDGKASRAHRVALELKIGRKLRSGEQARHICDNPPCVNQDHLEVGTSADNTKDRDDRGRDRYRYNSPEKIALRQEAYALLDEGKPQHKVAAILGVSQPTIGVWRKRRKTEP